MTRINCIPPEELTRQHLIAEYRELPRIFGLVRKRVARGHHPEDVFIFHRYHLGTGHCRFFYNKLKWLVLRYESLITEMKRRGYRPNHSTEGILEGIPDEWCGDWEPTEEDKELNRRRIRKRLKMS